MPQIKFTDRKLSSLAAPAEGQVDYWDTSLPGFGIRVSAGGRKTFNVMYRHQGRKRRYAIGVYGATALAKARGAARKALASASDGRDLAAERKARRVAETFTELVDAYIERHAKKKRRSWHRDEAILHKDFVPVLGHRKAREIIRRDVIAVLDGIVARGAPIQANRSLEIVRKVFNWALSRDLVESNPCHGIEKPAKENKRERVLSADEIRVFWFGLDKASMSPGVALSLKLQLATAQRKGEVIGAAWDEFDFDAALWLIPAHRSKNGREHRVPLSPISLDLLSQVRALNEESRWLFSSPNADKPVTGPAVDHAMRRSRTTIGVANVVPHDLRRTAASHMTSTGITRLTVSKILNHADPSVTATYDRHSYLPEMRSALDRWGSRLEEIVSGKGSKKGNVVSLASSREPR